MKIETGICEKPDLSLLPPTTSLVAFERAATYLSFAQAAAELERTPSAISHAISELEARFDCQLFERSGRSVKLTEAGVRYLAQVREAIKILNLGGQILGGKKEHNVVRLKAPAFFINMVMIPALGELAKSYPNIEVHIESTNTNVDWEYEDTDVEVRLCGEMQDGLYVHPIARLRAVPICSPKLTEGENCLKTVPDLQRCTLIHIERKPLTWSKWLQEAGYPDLVVRRNITFTSATEAFEAARKGMGVSFGIYPLVLGYPGFGKDIIMPFPDQHMRHASYNFVCRSEVLHQQKIGSVLKWLQSSYDNFVRSLDMA